MEDTFEHHENIRARIEQIVNEGVIDTGVDLDPKVKHLLINICKVMYDKGIKDGHRICQKVIEVSAEVYKE